MMMRKSSMGSGLVRGLALATLGAVVAVAGCSSAPESAESTSGNGSAVTADARRGPSSTSTASSPFAFFIATHTTGGYRVSEVNGGSFACGREQSTSCFVSAVDLSTLNLASDVSASLLARIGSNPNAPELLFAGSVTGGELAVVEVWRSPVAQTLSGTVFEVSHAPQQSLVVNQWSSANVGPLDFSSAPLAKYCEEEDGGVSCGPSLIPVQTDAVTPVGILVAGRPEWNGGFRVEQYFLEITVGYDDDGDGYSYCHDGETLCGGGKCSPQNICVKWGGRGLDKIYNPSNNSVFDGWLVSTGQLQSNELP